MVYPKEYVNSVIEIDIKLLMKNNIKGLILDVDNTLIDYNQNIPEGIEEWVQMLKKQDIKFCILSNSNNEEKIKKVSKKLEIPYLFFAKKPFKKGFIKAKKILDLKEENIGMVGDQVFTDVVGANRMKMVSILVKPIDKKDHLPTKIQRVFEKPVIYKYLKIKERK